MWDASFLCESSVTSVVLRVKVISLCPLRFWVRTNQLKFFKNVPELNHDVSSYEHMKRI